jgi:hypothetical protein
MFALATLSSLLYVWHTTFHLSRYMKSLQKDTKERRLSEDEEPTDTTALSAFARIKNFASKMSPIQQTVKTLRGNLRRLQLSVALIALSFLFKVFLYVTLAVGYISRDPTPPHNTTMTNPPYIDRFLCFPSYSNELRIVSRTVAGSPLVIPLFTLFCDVFSTMYTALSFPTHHHPHRLNQSTNQLKPHMPLCILISFMHVAKASRVCVAQLCATNTLCRISNYLSSGSKKKQGKSAKINITMAAVVPRLQISYADIFSGNFGGNAADLASSRTFSDNMP